MSFSIRKALLVTLQIILMILVASLAFNFAFTPKTTSMGSSNDGATLFLEDNISSLDTNGGSSESVNVSNPSGSGNDFDVSEYFESTTSDAQLRYYNSTYEPPEIVIDAQSQNTKLTYYNLTITDTYPEDSLIMPDDGFEEYGDPSSWRSISNETEELAYNFNVTGGEVLPYIFIDSFSIGLMNITDAPNGFKFKVVSSFVSI